VAGCPVFVGCNRLVKALYGEAGILYCLAEVNEFSNLGIWPEAMKVPYAKKWQKETDKLRRGMD
jgi:hypothetical protein